MTTATPDTTDQQQPVQTVTARQAAPRQDRKPHEVFANSIEMRFVRILGGKFAMGSPPGEPAQQDEQPRHPVRLSYSFGMGVYEVRQKDFLTVMSRNPSAFSGNGSRKNKVNDVKTANLPVENVSWSDAVAFCLKLSRHPEERRRGRIYRLPTEAEWEFCCRAETQGNFFFGERLLPKHACFLSNAAAKQHPVRVGSYPPNRFGLYDLHGNVFEWCLDHFQSDYYRHSPATDPQGPVSGDRRVIRGGGWNVGATPYCRSAFRDSMPANSREDYLGFRVVCLSGVFGFNESQLLANMRQFGGASTASIVELIEPSVVRVSVASGRGMVTGSGCLVFDNRTVVTNFHVIEQATKATVYFADGETIEVLGSVALQPENDLAVLRLSRPRAKGRPLVLATALPKKGERVVAFGAPFGLSFSTSDGIVSAVRGPAELARMGFPFSKTATWVQTTTPISPGNSGGPLVNLKGEIIGINTLTYRGKRGNAQNLNFAVSARDVQKLKAKITKRHVPLRSRGSKIRELLEEFLEQQREGNRQ